MRLRCLRSSACPPTDELAAVLRHSHAVLSNKDSKCALLCTSSTPGCSPPCRFNAGVVLGAAASGGPLHGPANCLGVNGQLVAQSVRGFLCVRLSTQLGHAHGLPHCILACQRKPIQKPCYNKGMPCRSFTRVPCGHSDSTSSGQPDNACAGAPVATRVAEPALGQKRTHQAGPHPSQHTCIYKLL